VTTKDFAEFLSIEKNLQFMQSGIGKSLMLDKVFMD